MAIVKMDKFTFLTFDAYKGELLKKLQVFGGVHFKNMQKDDLAGTELEFLKKDSTASVAGIENDLSGIRFAVSKIEPYASKPKGFKALAAPPKTIGYGEFDEFIHKYDYSSVFEQIKTLDEKINAVKSEVSKLYAETESLRAWVKLDVALPSISRLKTVDYSIGTVPAVALDSFTVQVYDKFPALHIETIGSIKDDAALLVIASRDECEEAFSFCRTLGLSKLTLSFNGVPLDIVKENQRRINELKKEQGTAHEQLIGLAGEYENLLTAQDCLEAALGRARVVENFLKTESVVWIEGFCPQEDTGKLRETIEDICGADYYLETEKAEKDSEDTPIKLKNNGLVAPFESITEMYSMPKYGEIDPTPVLMPFYFSFFGLMVGDAGYGILMLLATAFALKFLHFKQGMKRFIQFFFWLSFAVIGAGFIYGSMFGFTFFKPIQTAGGGYKPILDSQSNDDIVLMLVLSVAIGTVQIIFGLLVKGYMLVRDGQLLAALFDSVLWIVTVLSGIGLILSAAGLVTGVGSEIVKWGMIVGIVGLAVTQGRSSPSLGGKIGSGLYAVYGLSSYVGDLVSYTRIAALALSGAYIAYSFNLMMGLLPAGPIRIIGGTLIFVLGQSLNLGLAALGAYVHTCRLQYVEYFGKFYEGGGVPFQPFKLNNNYIEVK